MKNTLEYKGYVGSLEFSEEDSLLFGKVLGIRSLISYEGESVKELISDFHRAVDEYLQVCEAEGEKPECPFKDSFNIRVALQVHKPLFMEAVSRNISLISLVQAKLSAGY